MLADQKVNDTCSEEQTKINTHNKSIHEQIEFERQKIIGQQEGLQRQNVSSVNTNGIEQTTQNKRDGDHTNLSKRMRKRERESE